MNYGNYGARGLPEGQVQFRIWAPDCTEVKLVLKDAESVLMQAEDDGIFSTIIEGGAGIKYKFQVNPEISVPDPASFQQEDDLDGYSVVLGHEYDWVNTAWHGRPWQESVIYELHAGVFGGFTGITRELPRLRNLGVTAIELMPIADFPGQRNWGYDGVLVYAPDSSYGTPDDLKRMIDTAHGLGLQVFLDVVYNHFGPDGNYLNLYASRFFNDEMKTPWGDAIDFAQPHVRRFYIENALHWLLDYKFDGLRFDAVHAISDKSFLLEMAEEIHQKTRGRHVHLILENEKNDASVLSADGLEVKFTAQWNDDFHHCLHVLLTGESEGYYSHYSNPAENLACCLRDGFVFPGGHANISSKDEHAETAGSLPFTAFVICLQNHDQIGNRAMGERLTSLASPDALKAAMYLQLLCPQIPMLFMGEECGETAPFLYFTDHHAALADAVREGRRNEFAHFEAFSDASVREKIPDPNARATFEASMIDYSCNLGEKQTKIFSNYQQILRLRAEYVAPHLTGSKCIDSGTLGDKGIRAMWRLGNGDTLTIAANFGKSDLAFEAGVGRLLAQSKVQDFATGLLAGESACVWLQPHE